MVRRVFEPRLYPDRSKSLPSYIALTTVDRQCLLGALATSQVNLSCERDIYVLLAA